MNKKQYTNEKADDLNALLGKVDQAADRFNETAGKVESLEKEIRKVRDYAKATGSQGLGAVLKSRLGRSGTQDWLEGFGRFCLAAYHDRMNNGRVPADLRDVDLDYQEKAYDTVTSATAGYAVPDAYIAEIDLARLMVGKFLGMCRHFTISQGQQVKGAHLATTTAAWEPQADAFLEVTPATTQILGRPRRIGSYSVFSNELFELPGLNFSAVVAEAIIRAIVTAEEDDLIAGDTGATDVPSDGILVDTGTTALALTITADTPGALVTGLMQPAITSNNALADGGVVLISWDHALSAYAAQIGSTSYGWPAMDHDGEVFSIGPWKILPNDSCDGTTDYGIMVDPADVWIFGYKGMRVDFDPYVKFVEYQTRMRVYRHTDWAFPEPARICYNDFT